MGCDCHRFPCRVSGAAQLLPWLRQLSVVVRSRPFAGWNPRCVNEPPRTWSSSGTLRNPHFQHLIPILLPQSPQIFIVIMGRAKLELLPGVELIGLVAIVQQPGPLCFGDLGPVRYFARSSVGRQRVNSPEVYLSCRAGAQSAGSGRARL